MGSPEPQDDLTRVEVVLRSFIGDRLQAEFGTDWIRHSGVAENRLRLWARRRDNDQERRDGARVPESLLDYSDLSDLWQIIDVNWSLFEPCFRDRDETRVLMAKLVELRNPEKHARGLLDFEREYIRAISRQFRNQIVVYRSELDAGEEYFPVLEFVRDSFGNVAQSSGELVVTGLILRPGDEVRWECSARDPDGTTLRWWYQIRGNEHDRAEGGHLSWTVEERDIGDPATVFIHMAADREHHRQGTYDAYVAFQYRVFPSR